MPLDVTVHRYSNISYSSVCKYRHRLFTPCYTSVLASSGEDEGGRRSRASKRALSLIAIQVGSVTDCPTFCEDDMARHRPEASCQFRSECSANRRKHIWPDLRWFGRHEAVTPVALTCAFCHASRATRHGLCPVRFTSALLLLLPLTLGHHARTHTCSV